MMSTTRPLPLPSLFPEFDLLRLAESPAWHDSAPAAVREADSWTEGSRGWRLWRKHLRRRKRPLALADLIGTPSGRQAPWRWGLADMADAGRGPEMLRWLDRLARGKPCEPDVVEAELAQLVSNDPPGPPSLADALALLGWAHSLPALAQVLDAAAWWELVAHLLQAVNAAKLAPAPADPRVELLFLCELPTTLAYVLPELWPCRSLWSDARAALIESWEQMLDSGGLLRASQQIHLRPLLASWTRVWHMGRRLDEMPWPAKAEERFARAWQQALRLVRRDGSQMLLADPQELSGPRSGARGKKSSKRAVASAGDWLQGAIRSLDLSLSAPASSSGKSQPAAAGAPTGSGTGDWVRQASPSSHSPWAQSAVLRTDWGRRAITLAVDYHDLTPRIEVNDRGRPLLAGAWRCQVQRGTETLTPRESGTAICWTSDDDVDYLELEADLSDQVRVQRQFLLARRDRFLLLIDVVLADVEGPLVYQSSLGWGPQAQGQGQAETREVALQHGPSGAWVLPLSQSEWRCDGRSSALDCDQRQLVMRQAGQAPALAAALWIDLDPARAKQPFTWRQLTVAQNRQIVHPWQAVGYRVQFGDRQWLVYRSLDGVANRTLLGKNLVTEFFVGRFSRKGTTETLLELDHQAD